MTLWRLVAKEILHRPLNAALAMLAVAVAVGVLLAEVAILRAHDIRSEQMLNRKQREADRRLGEMEDDYRKYMKELGFNLLILPKEQDLAEFWEKGYATHAMSEDSAGRLAESGTDLVRHLLPIVQQRVLWPEQKRRVILIGTRGEVPMKHRRPGEPMLLAVPKGKTVVGYELAESLGLKTSDTIALLGGRFVVDGSLPERGSVEDATIWLHLADAQKLLNMQGRINAIEALKCRCEGVGTTLLRREITRILPETKVVVRENKVTVRAKARDRARAEHEKAMAEEKQHSAHIRRGQEAFAAVVVPLAILAAAVWIGLLSLNDSRRRRAEIGVLRAIGVRSRTISCLFLAKAILVGLVGAVLGYGAALVVGTGVARAGDGPAGTESLRALFPASLVVLVLLAAPILSALASWAPAIMAGRQDPAVALREE